MSIASEIERIQTAKATLKAKLNSKNDEQHQITDETLDEFGDFCDSIPTGSSYLPDWSELGYADTPKEILSDFNYAKDIKDNWNSSVTSMNAMYYNNRTIALFPMVDTSNVTDMQYAFSGCYYMQEIAPIDTSKVTNMESMFANNQRLYYVPQLNTSSVTKMYNMFSRLCKIVKRGFK